LPHALGLPECAASRRRLAAGLTPGCPIWIFIFITLVLALPVSVGLAHPVEERLERSVADMAASSFDDPDWASAHSLVDYLKLPRPSCTGATPTKSGAYIDTNGRVWTYAHAATQCHGESGETSARAAAACRFATSKLVARVSPGALRELKKVVARARYTRHVGALEQYYEETLLVPGARTRDGKALLVAGCTPGGSQLDSPEGKFIVELFRHVRRAAKLRTHCRGIVGASGELAPGLRAWWLP
jgi:hypothetical protein